MNPEQMETQKQKRRESDTSAILVAAIMLPPQTETYLRVGTKFGKNQLRNIMMEAQKRRRDERLTNATQKRDIVKMRCILKKQPGREADDVHEISNAAKKLEPQEEAYIRIQTVFSRNQLKNIGEQIAHALQVVRRDGRFVTLSQKNNVVHITCQCGSSQS